MRHVDVIIMMWNLSLHFGHCDHSLTELLARPQTNCLVFVSVVSSSVSFLTDPPHFISHTDPLLPTYFTPMFDMTPPSFTNYFLPEGSESPLPGETTTSSAGSPRFLGHGLNENLIPIYCSILAAVVVGLVAYIVFKRSVTRKGIVWKLLLG